MRSESSSTCESDWISYSDRKCFKVLERKGSESEAKESCIKMDSSSTLITIESKDEQNFISNHMIKYSSISPNVWIGLEYIDNTFKWMDGKPLFYQNWGENSGRDGNSKCVQLSLAKADLGKWTDDLCRRKYLIVCQKKQSTRTVLSEELKNITKFIGKLQATNEKLQATIDKHEKANEKLKIEMNLSFFIIKLERQYLAVTNDKQERAIENLNREIQSIIPLGFLYTQLPDQSPPEKLWPNMKWSEVTQQYSGLFFRAEGGGSEPFGRTQSANYSEISKIRECSYNNNPKAWTHVTCNTHGVRKDWSEDFNSVHGLFSLFFSRQPVKTDLEIPRLEYGNEFNSKLLIICAIIFK